MFVPYKIWHQGTEYKAKKSSCRNRSCWEIFKMCSRIWKLMPVWPREVAVPRSLVQISWSLPQNMGKVKNPYLSPPSFVLLAVTRVVVLSPTSASRWVPYQWLSTYFAPSTPFLTSKPSPHPHCSSPPKDALKLYLFIKLVKEKSESFQTFICKSE